MNGSSFGRIPAGLRPREGASVRDRLTRQGSIERPREPHAGGSPARSRSVGRRRTAGSSDLSGRSHARGGHRSRGPLALSGTWGKVERRSGSLGYRGTLGRAQAVTFSGDGRWLVTGGGGHQIVRLWDARRHTARQQLSASSGAMDLSRTLPGNAARRYAGRRPMTSAAPRSRLISVPELELVLQACAPHRERWRGSRPTVDRCSTATARAACGSTTRGRGNRLPARCSSSRSPSSTADISPDGRQLATTYDQRRGPGSGTSRRAARSAAPCPSALGRPRRRRRSSTTAASMVVAPRPRRLRLGRAARRPGTRHACDVAGRTAHPLPSGRTRCRAGTTRPAC